MTPRQIALIRMQFGTLGRNADGFAALFYDHLFLLDSTLRPLFPADMRGQRVKLVKALAHVILSLDRLDAVMDQVRELGTRHAGYGVQPYDYATVGEALLAALEEALGEDFSAEGREAWTLAYGTIAEAMIAAVSQAKVKAAA